MTLKNRFAPDLDARSSVEPKQLIYCGHMKKLRKRTVIPTIVTPDMKYFSKLLVF